MATPLTKPAVLLPPDGRCLPQSLREWLDDSSVLDLTLDLKAQTDSLDIERQLRARCAAAIAVEDGIRMGRRRIIRDLFALPIGRMSVAVDKILQRLQGGLERFQHEPHKLSDAGSNPAPATNLTEASAVPAPEPSNPNQSPEAFSQANPFPQGRWTSRS